MNYNKIVVNGLREKEAQGTTYVSYFKREAKKEKNDNYCEYSDFFSGCKLEIQRLKENIEQQRRDKEYPYKKDMNLLYLNQMTENGQRITDKEEKEKLAKKLKEQMEEDLELNGSKTDFLLELEEGIQQAEMELNNEKPESDMIQTKQVNNVTKIVSSENVVVNNGSVDGQVKNKIVNNGKSRIIIAMSVLVPTLSLLLYIIVEKSNIISFFKNLFSY